MLSLQKVCEVYHLHRETYHLAIAYIDQYLSQTKNFLKNKFQLLGITSLFIAAKIEVNKSLQNFFSIDCFSGDLSTTINGFFIRNGWYLFRRRYSQYGIGFNECKTRRNVC